MISEKPLYNNQEVNEYIKQEETNYYNNINTKDIKKENKYPININTKPKIIIIIIIINNYPYNNGQNNNFRILTNKNNIIAPQNYQEK